MTKEVVAVLTTMLVAVVMDMGEAMADTEAAEAVETEAIIMALATMVTVVVTAMARHHLLPAASRTSLLVLLHKLQHTLAETVVVVFLHRRLRVGCQVWLSLPLLNTIKVVMAEAITTMAAATTMEADMEAVAIMAAETIMVVVIAAVVEEEVAVVAEVDMTDIRSLLLKSPSGGKTLLTKIGSGSRKD